MDGRDYKVESGVYIYIERQVVREEARLDRAFLAARPFVEKRPGVESTPWIDPSRPNRSKQVGGQAAAVVDQPRNSMPMR